MEIVPLVPSATPSNCLKGKVVLITGASSGIGRALALSSAQHGATTVLLGKSLPLLESLYDEIIQQGYPEPVLHPVNLLQLTPDEAQLIATHLKQLFSRLDGIVHNAAITGPITPTEHLAPVKWQEVIHLNLNIPYLLTHALLPLMKETPEGATILFTVANEAKNPKAYWGPYGASKAGLMQLAQTLHQELEANTQIRVNCINPGKVRTAFRVRTYPGIELEALPLPEHIMPAYLYLLSDASQSIRGKWVEAQ